MMRGTHFAATAALLGFAGCGVLSLTGCGVKEEQLHETLAPVARQTEELQADQEGLQARLNASEEEMRRLRAELDALRDPKKGKAPSPAQAASAQAAPSQAASTARMPDGNPIPPPRVLTPTEAAKLDAAGTGTASTPGTSGVSVTAASASSTVMPPHGPVHVQPGTPPLSTGTLSVNNGAPPALPTMPEKAPAPGKPNPAMKPVKVDDAQSAYQNALNTYERRSFAEAETLFDQYLQTWPTGKLAPNALYWKAECLYSRGRYADCVFIFKDVVTRHPKHPKAPDALLKAAMAYKRLGDTDNAALHISVLAEDYPKSTALKRARELGFGS